MFTQLGRIIVKRPRTIISMGEINKLLLLYYLLSCPQVITQPVNIVTLSFNH